MTGSQVQQGCAGRSLKIQIPSPTVQLPVQPRTVQEYMVVHG